MKKMIFIILCLFFTALFCKLGVWQLHRYHFKKDLLSTYEKNLSQSPIPFSESDAQPFKRVMIKGKYLNHLNMLIQNRFYHDLLGFEVLTPLQIPGDKKLLLVDRGWVKGEKIPQVQVVQAEQHINGYLKFLNEYQFILGKNILNPSISPLVMQKIDVNELNQITHQDFYPFILRLDASQPNGFVRDWTITTVIPERHFMYAIQWFVMALVLLIACIGFLLRGDHGKEIKL